MRFLVCNSYDYFKIAQADGTILVADDEHTHHRDNIGYGSIDGRPFEAEVEAIGQWETRLLGGNFDALLRQRFSRLAVRYDGEEQKVMPSTRWVGNDALMLAGGHVAASA